MNSVEDRAIIVGVECYPELDDLGGPENDARAFQDWVLSPTGGNVPSQNVELIVTSQFGPPFGTVDLAQPTAERVHRAFENLQNIANANAARGLRRRVGRRLYIYMAGHGFVPRDDQTALLMANATRVRLGPGFHILGQYNADWFFKAGYFDEIVLFMDCCRERFVAPALDMPYGEVNAEDGLERKRLYGFGTKSSRLSRERPMAGGGVRGVFTQALLEGLSGGACEPHSGGQVTANSLRDYLLEEKIWQTFLAPEDLGDPDIPRRPDVLILDTNFTLVTIHPPPQYPVIIHFNPGSLGKIVEVLDGKDSHLVGSTVIAENLEWQLRLERGHYLAQIPADRLRTPIPVYGTGEIHVSL
jgi:uncharacterized caspase-like protein